MRNVDLIRSLQRYSGSYGVKPDDYGALVAYLLGYDDALQGGFLTGFQELIELKSGRTSNRAWWVLALDLRWPDGHEGVADIEKVAWLFDLLEEFFVVDVGRRRRLFADWAEMAQRDGDGWFGVDPLRVGQSPAAEHVGLDEAAQQLGLQPMEVIALVGVGKLKAGRVRGEVRITSESLLAYNPT